jgi:hypothetical protein
MVVAAADTGPYADIRAGTYADYSRINMPAAGQYWSDGAAAGQWAWTPHSASESDISWGDPANWPPKSAEKFVRSSDWLLLDGWADHGTYYTQRVTKELVGDASCNNLVPIASDGALQHYVRWAVQSHAYCLKAWGTITEASSGKSFEFGHTQIWSPPASCSNQYLGTRTCIKQWESWWDNNHDAPGTPISRRLERDQFIARGVGMAFKIQQYFPTPWLTELRYSWNWE